MDLEKNDLNLQNEDDLFKAEELNNNQQGKEVFREDEERFLTTEENEKNPEENDLSSSKKNSGSQYQKKLANQPHALGASLSIPGIVVSLVASIAIIGSAAGIIPSINSGHVEIFLSRSTELGFEITKDLEKTYTVSLSNEEQNFSEEIILRNQLVFSDLTPNTLYDLKVFDTSVTPSKRVYYANYLTKANDDYFAYVDSNGITDGVLNFNVSYEGENINFATVEVLGDNLKSLFIYEGAPKEEFTVNIGENSNVTCRVSINGDLTHFAQLVNPDKTWLYDETNHWHDDNGQIVDLAAHTFVEKTIREATYEQEGLKCEVCSVCGYKGRETVIPAKEHNYGNDWYYDDNNHWKRCIDYGYTDLTSPVEPHDHQFKETVNGNDIYECVCGHVDVREHQFTLEESLIFEYVEETNSLNINGYQVNNFDWTQPIVLPTTHVYEDKGELPITGIQMYGALSNRDIVSLTVPSTYTYMGSQCIKECINMQSLTIPFVGENLTLTDTAANSTFGHIFCLNKPYPDDQYEVNLYDAGGDQRFVPKSLATINVTGGILVNSAMRGLYYAKNIDVSGVTSIGDYAFADYVDATEGISNIESITISSSLTYIGDYAFSNNPLTVLTFNGTIAEWEDLNKGTDWNTDSSLTTVRCSNGDITL